MRPVTGRARKVVCGYYAPTPDLVSCPLDRHFTFDSAEACQSFLDQHFPASRYGRRDAPFAVKIERNGAGMTYVICEGKPT